MKVRWYLVMSGAAPWFAIAAAACGSHNQIDTGGGTSGSGESCTRTFDCKSPFVCIDGVCGAALNSGGDASAGEGGGGAGSVGGPRLGQVNESCQTTMDCQAPLECIKNACAPASFGLTATGKSCTGECTTAADCCELPVDFSANIVGGYVYPPDGGLPSYQAGLSGYVRCEDLLGYLGGKASICTTSGVTSGQSQACFDYATYCQCSPSPWACTNNACVYTAPCTSTSSRAAIGACPSETRTGRALSTMCNIAGSATAGSCQAGCVADSDCSGKVPTGALTQQACSGADAGATDCTCYQSACYFKCSKDIDCASGFACDTTTSLCKAAGCTTDADCVESTGSPRSQCMSGVCKTSCASDPECAPPSTICSSGFCAPAGCSSNADCTGSGAHLFCVPAVATTYTSAVTD